MRGVPTVGKLRPATEGNEDYTPVALTIMIAESRAEEKEMMVRVVKLYVGGVI